MKLYWHESSKNIIGKKLKELRKQHGLSQERLASLLQLQGMECSDLTILRIEKGQRFVPDYEIVLIAKFFDITTDELLGIKEAEQ